MRYGILAAILALALAAPALAQHDHGHPAKEAPAAAPMAFDAPPAVGTKATCPVTGEEFTVAADTARSEFEGRHYVFCCPACKPKFDADPHRYVHRR